MSRHAPNRSSITREIVCAAGLGAEEEDDEEIDEDEDEAAAAAAAADDEGAVATVGAVLAVSAVALRGAASALERGTAEEFDGAATAVEVRTEETTLAPDVVTDGAATATTRTTGVGPAADEETAPIEDDATGCGVRLGRPTAGGATASRGRFRALPVVVGAADDAGGPSTRRPPLGAAIDGRRYRPMELGGRSAGVGAFRCGGCMFCRAEWSARVKNPKQSDLMSCTNCWFLARVCRQHWREEQ